MKPQIICATLCLLFNLFLFESKSVSLINLGLNDVANITKILYFSNDVNEGLTMHLNLLRKLDRYFVRYKSFLKLFHFQFYLFLKTRVILSSHLPNNSKKTVIMDHVMNVCSILKRKIKGSDLLLKVFNTAFVESTNLSHTCPLNAGIYGFYHFKLDLNRIPLNFFMKKYIFSLHLNWYTLKKDKERKKFKEIDVFSANVSYKVLD